MITTDLLAQIVPGIYAYTSILPHGCQGCRYRLHRTVLSVPSMQHMVLVEALEGPDAGLWFVCPSGNFAIRYRLLEATP